MARQRQDVVRPDQGNGGARESEGLVKRFLRGLARVEIAITLVAFTLVVVLVSAQLVLRAAFGYGLVWVQEIAQLFILVAYFFGASYIFKSRQYVIVEFVFARLPHPFQLALYLLAQALTFAFALVLVVELIGIAPPQLRMATYILHIPRFYSSLPLILASASMAATAAYYGLAALKVVRAHGAALGIEALEDRVHLFPGHRGGEGL